MELNEEPCTGEGEETLPKLLIRNAESYADHKAAIREKRFGIWQSWAWAGYLENVRSFAMGLASLGFGRGDKLAVIGDNRPRLYWAQMAAQCLGGIAVPIYQDSIEEEMRYVIDHSDARMVAAEDQEQVDKILELKKGASAIERIIYDDPKGLRNYRDPHLISFEEVQEKGGRFESEAPGYFEREVEKGVAEDIAVIMYTSGTTGFPKGVMLSQRNLLSIAEKILAVEDYNDEDEVMAYLPMAWVGDVIFSLALSIKVGFAVNCPEEPETAQRDLREIGPTIMLCPPRLWEKMLTDVQVKIGDADRFKRSFFNLFMRAAEKRSAIMMNGRSVPPHLRLLYRLGDLLLFGAVKDQMGLGRTRYAYTGGAPLGPDAFSFFRSIGINLKQLYGLTETSGVCVIQPDGRVNPESVGIPCPGVEVTTSDAGEVLIRGDFVFRGYHKDPEATAAALVDGWLKTGDAGFFDREGHLKIIDRLRDMSTLADGTMFSPQYIENKLKFSPYIKEVVALGNGRDYVAAIINIDLGAVGNWAERRGLPYTSYTDLSQKSEVYDLVQGEIARMNESLSRDPQTRRLQVRRFLVLHKELDPDDAEITRTRKLRRGFIAEKYADIINALYSDVKQLLVSSTITYEDGRRGEIESSVRIAEMEVGTAST